MKIAFAKLVPGQVFQWNAQTFVKIHSRNGQNAAQLYVNDGPYGLFMNDVEVEVDDDQLKQTPLLMDEVVELPKAVYDAMCDAIDRELLEDWLSACRRLVQ